MRETTILSPDLASGALVTGPSRVKLFLALSRTPHGLLDLAAPALAALLWLGDCPPLGVMVLGLVTVFAGYTAVYALNDLMDYRTDREKLRLAGGANDGNYLDAVLVRHPLAAGKISFREGLLWTGLWALIALLGAYRLNPVCALIFILGCLLEAAYCLLFKVSQFRLLVAGVVKSLGAVAAVFAVDPRPSPEFLVLLALWLFFWELGGQNIPADWHDVEQDRELDARTIPVVYGLPKAGVLSLIFLVLSLGFGMAVGRTASFPLSHFQQFLVLGLGIYLLLFPAWRLARSRNRIEAALLFNRASYYPLAIMAVVLLNFLSRANLPVYV
jgi:4-hydroxybenzoate polyprenyltransferase